MLEVPTLATEVEARAGTQERDGPHGSAQRRTREEAAKWIGSSMASVMFGSASWGLRQQIADVVRGRSWETTLKNEEMRP